MDSYHILLVDDDREIVKSLGKLLELEGYKVYKAYDGMEALDCLMTEQIHLILLDVMMPRLNGLSALMKIREKNNIPIIILSAKTEESDKVLGLSMGADDYVTKPYNTQELMARVKSQLIWPLSRTGSSAKKNTGNFLFRITRAYCCNTG